MIGLTTIGIIGSGMIGSAVMRLAASAGHRVMIANSRGPESLHDLVRSVDGSVAAATIAEIDSAAELVVYAAPLSAYADFEAQAFTDRTVIDTSNYYPERFGRLNELDASGLPSSAFLQRRWRRARVVKALNAMDFVRLEVLAGAPGGARTAVPIAGDVPSATASVAEFVESIGFVPLIAGTLAESWRFQPGTPLHVNAYIEMPVGVDDPVERFAVAMAVPVAVERTQELLAAAGC